VTPPALLVLQARMGSTRLPGKVLADVAGTSVLERCVRRLLASGAGPVVVATTGLPADDQIASAAAALGVLLVRGPVDDVLARYVQAASGWTGPVVRATADNPLVDIEAPARVLQALRAGADYVVESGLPVGAAVEGMTVEALRQAGARATDAYDREHVTPWIRRGGTRGPVRTLDAPPDLARPDLRFTVDTLDDLAHVRRVVAAAGADPLLPLQAFIRAAARLPRRSEP
jgi:spore coat polysaccharide biosynthesis protein SpsF